MVFPGDSVLVTPGTGATIATHLVAAKEYQVVMQADASGHILGSLDSYVSVYRLATEAAVSALSFTHVANADKQYATIYHAAAATKLVRIHRVELVLAATAAGIWNVELYYLSATTAPATGNPAITPQPINRASAAAEATCLALPTTAGSHTATQTMFSQELNLGANTAQTTSFPADPITLWPAEGTPTEAGPLIIRAGVAEGYAITCRNSAAVAIKFTARIFFTEEA